MAAALKVSGPSTHTHSAMYTDRQTDTHTHTKGGWALAIEYCSWVEGQFQAQLPPPFWLCQGGRVIGATPSTWHPASQPPLSLRKPVFPSAALLIVRNQFNLATSHFSNLHVISRKSQLHTSYSTPFFTDFSAYKSISRSTRLGVGSHSFTCIIHSSAREAPNTCWGPKIRSCPNKTGRDRGWAKSFSVLSWN